MRFDIITIFPEMFSALDASITGRAIENKLIDINYWNPRDFSADKHHRVDDRPYGGGPGMVMLPQPIESTIKKIRATNNGLLIHLSPQGKPLTQELVQELSSQQEMILLSGRYEGIDERIIEEYVNLEISLGDYVLSGGELPAMVLIDAITRLLPEALGHEDSASQDSFMQGLLDCPHYTRPEIFNGQKVPDVLLSGDHKKIASWRLQQALGRTQLRRPDLLEKYELTPEEKQLLKEFIKDNENRGK